jgi:hypothetical protein
MATSQKSVAKARSKKIVFASRFTRPYAVATAKPTEIHAKPNVTASQNTKKVFVNNKKK